METGFQLRQLLRQHPLHAGILQSYRVEHSGRALCNTGGRIAEAGFLGGTLEGEGPQAVDIVQFRELIAVAEGTAGRNHLIIQLNTRQIHPQIYHIISSFSSTGPSLQIRLLPYLVLQLHPIHAPNPQPIRSSKLSRPEVVVALYTAFSIGRGPQAQK